MRAKAANLSMRRYIIKNDATQHTDPKQNPPRQTKPSLSPSPRPCAELLRPSIVRALRLERDVSGIIANQPSIPMELNGVARPDQIRVDRIIDGVKPGRRY